MLLDVGMCYNILTGCYGPFDPSFEKERVILFGI